MGGMGNDGKDIEVRGWKYGGGGWLQDLD